MMECRLVAPARGVAPVEGKEERRPPLLSRASRAASVGERVERLLEAVRVRALGLGQRLEPVGDLVEAFVARRLSPCPGTCPCTRGSRRRSPPSGSRACGRSAARWPDRRPAPDTRDGRGHGRSRLRRSNGTPRPRRSGLRRRPCWRSTDSGDSPAIRRQTRPSGCLRSSMPLSLSCAMSGLLVCARNCGAAAPSRTVDGKSGDLDLL